MRRIPDESIDMAITSPPYYGLRDYGRDAETIWCGDKTCNHEWSDKIVSHDNLRSSKVGLRTTVGSNKNLEFGNGKHGRSDFCSLCGAWKGQLGLEPTLGMYLKHLLIITAEIKRVLKRTGVLFWNHGDSYGGSWQNYGARESKQRPKNTESWNRLGSPTKNNGIPPSAYLQAKSLLLQNYRLIQRMIDEQGWVLRNMIIWHKPNCMPSSVKDRFTVDYEPVFFLVKNKRYFFERQFEPSRYENRNSRRKYGWKGRVVDGIGRNQPPHLEAKEYGKRFIKDNRNKRCVWRIPTQPFKESHFATFPEALIKPMIKAGCPELVCRKCGTPVMRKIAGKKGSGDSFNIRVRDMQIHPEKWGKLYKATEEEKQEYDERHYKYKTTRRESIEKCDCNAGFESGIVLDVFAGSGTTGVVAKKLGRRFVLVELKPEYCKMARKRLMSVSRTKLD